MSASSINVQVSSVFKLQEAETSMVYQGDVQGIADVMSVSLQSKRSAKPPREEGAPLRVWGSVGGPLAPSSAEGQEAMAGIGSLSLEVSL